MYLHSYNNMSILHALCSLLLLLLFAQANSLKPTSIPPLIDVPTFSLSTRGKDPSRDTMNILTYASPISIKPYRMWSISLYKGTLSHENFVRERRGVLQLLAPEHASHGSQSPGDLIRVLGGTSGKDVNKQLQSEMLGYAWKKLDGVDVDISSHWPCVLPGCLYYLQLELEGDLIDCGSHEVALCRVVSMIADESIENAAMELGYLSTRKMRDMGIVSELGRIVEKN
jgi:flavin reductase (DIM6/NTAB) family NADH-FMN oxidoreductase RutF